MVIQLSRTLPSKRTMPAMDGLTIAMLVALEPEIQDSLKYVLETFFPGKTIREELHEGPTMMGASCLRKKSTQRSLPFIPCFQNALGGSRNQRCNKHVLIICLFSSASALFNPTMIPLSTQLSLLSMKGCPLGSAHCTIHRRHPSTS